jgi:hypothetical protein
MGTSGSEGGPGKRAGSNPATAPRLDPYLNVRRYRAKLLIKPSKAAVRRLRERLAAEMRTLRGGNAMAVIARLNPVIRGSPGAASLLRDVA